MGRTNASEARQSLTLDPQQVLHRCMDDVQFLLKVLDCFTTDMPVCLSELQSAIERGDGSAAARHAHSIKGAAGLVTGDAIHPAVHELEQLCQAGDLSVAMSLFNHLHRELDGCVSQAKQIRTDMAASRA